MCRQEGKYVADFMKNMVSHSVTPLISDLINGDDLRGQTLEMILRNDEVGDASLFIVEINALESK